jgi:3-dehydroquinate dehydratase
LLLQAAGIRGCGAICSGSHAQRGAKHTRMRVCVVVVRVGRKGRPSRLASRCFGQARYGQFA